MNTKNFLSLIEDHPQKELLFAYGQQQYVPKAYHITEVKNVSIESVDCGGFSHSEKQTVIQLWVDENETAERYMTAAKAAKIFQIVNKVKPLSQQANIFFEWGTAGLATSNYQIDAVEHVEDKIIVKMSVPATACKPRLQMQESGDSGSCCSEKGCC